VRVLLVNQYYPPDGAATATMAAGAAAALTKRGHEVMVLAGRASYDVTERDAWRPWQTSTVDGITVRRVGSSAFDRSRMAGRVSNYLTYGAWCAPLAATTRADVVVGMSDPPFAGILAGAIAALRRRPFVYWLHDLHPEFPLATGDLKRNVVVTQWQALHRRALRRATAVVVLGDDMAMRATAAGADAERVHVVRSGSPVYPSATPGSDAVRAEIRGDAPFVVLHAGNLGQAVAWRALVDGVKALRPDEANLVFVGGGAERDAAVRAADDSDVIRFHDYWPPEQVGDVLRAGDVDAVTVRRGLEGLVVPSRLYSVLAAGRPVLAVADETSDVVTLVRRHECGLVADPDDPASVADAISWARGHPVELAEMGKRAQLAAVDYDRDTLLDRLVEIIEAAA